jgi:hypothetical protein
MAFIKNTDNKFSPESVELTPYHERQQQATVTDEDLAESQTAWENEPPDLDDEDVTLILDADAE